VSLDLIRRYTRGYAEVIAIQSTFMRVLSSHGIDTSLETFEADILLDSDVVRRVAKHAEAWGVDVAAIARVCLFAAAEESIPSRDYDPARRPPFRPKPPGGRTRVRFWVPREPYEEAKKLIIASRRSVSHALEDKLRAYVEEDL
jgi:hypothetical protein